MNINFDIVTHFIIIIALLFSIYYIFFTSKKNYNLYFIIISIIVISIFILLIIKNNHFIEKFEASNNNFNNIFYTNEHKNKYFKLINACTKLGINTNDDHQITDCIYMLNNCKNNGFNHISKTIGGIECGPCFADDKQLCSNTICLDDTVQDGICDVAINVNDYPLSTLQKTNYE
jgi:energy-coupling factor transporter transmembrane protein EcfT